jgi:hypothetical protein
MRIFMMTLATMLMAGAARAAPLETYAKRSSMHSVLISPDGGKVAFVQRVNGKEAVVIDQLSPAALVGNIPPGPGFDGLSWIDSNRLLAYGVYGVLVVDLEKRKSTRLLDKSKSELSEVVGQPVVRTRAGRTVVAVAGSKWIEQTLEPILVDVDLETGKETREALVPSKKRAGWQVDSSGSAIAQAVYDEETHVWTLQLRRGSEWREVYSVEALFDPPVIVGMTRDGTGLVLQIYSDHGLEFRSLSLADGKLGGLVPEYAGLMAVVYDPRTHLPIGGLKEGLEPNFVFFDPKDQALWDGILKLFPDEEVTLESWSDDRSKVVVSVIGLKHGVSYQLVDTATHRTSTIGPEFDGLTPNDFADVQIASYPAKDGLPIQALLTLPRGRDPKNLPLVVLPHSQISEGEQVGYSEWAQAFASRGYAVLQPQYRGTFGLGWKLESAAAGEFGRKMQTDMSDGVRALAKAGVIDPKQVCIVGGPGYGGYAALAGVMFESGVYRCAVAIDPWVDIRKAETRRDENAKHNITLRNWERLIGGTDSSGAEFDRISPSKHASALSAPLLIIQPRVGGDDSISLVNAMKLAGKTAELMPLESVEADAVEARRLKQLQAMVSFVEKNNPPN